MKWYEFPVGNDKKERYARSHKLFNLLKVCMTTIFILQHLYEKQKMLKVCLLLNLLTLPTKIWVPISCSRRVELHQD